MKNLILVLHAHLPWGHLDEADDAAARWLLEACVDCYQPLLDALERLDADGVPFRITLSVSPPLAAMWSSPRLEARLAQYVEVEVRAWRGADRAFAKAADFHLARLADDRRDLFSAFSALPQVELITSTATHGFLPLLATVPAAARAQVQLAAQGAPGLWLAECGYVEGCDRWLVDAGVRYCFLDQHALAHAEHGHRRPVKTAAGLHAFARDPLASEQVWSKSAGYPGDRAYLDFHHRVNGRRVLKVPGEGAWDPVEAHDRARTHARHFVAQRLATDAQAIVAPYDAELFGHWWFEGPDFLEAVIREAADAGLSLATASDHLARAPGAEQVDLTATSWGRGGHSAVWLDARNAWMWPHLHRAAEAMTRLEAPDRVKAQAARELLLAQSSDWPFLIEAQTNAGYAKARFEDHLLAFRRLSGEAPVDPAWLAQREAQNNLFGAIDTRVYGAAPWPR